MALTSIHWKILTAFGAAGALILAFLLVTARAEIRHLEKIVANRDARIEVLTSDLAQANTNVAQFKTAIADARAKMEARAAADAAKLADTTVRLNAAQQTSRTASARAAQLAAPARGDTLESRVRDVDARILETLK